MPRCYKNVNGVDPQTVQVPCLRRNAAAAAVFRRNGVIGEPSRNASNLYDPVMVPTGTRGELAARPRSLGLCSDQSMCAIKSEEPRAAVWRHRLTKLEQRFDE